jgi:putative PIN family toxin of toxin-antitoxin system
MKVFFDTNVYIAEILLGRAARRMITATSTARWRIYCSAHVLDELERVLTRELGFARRLASVSRDRIRRRATMVSAPSSRHAVRTDPHDSPILQSALRCGADYVVTNDRHLLELHPYEGVEIVSMDRYLGILEDEGLLT